jgi:hypothetical protein
LICSGSSEKAQTIFFRTIASEHREMFGASARLVSEIASFGDTPLLVIAASFDFCEFLDESIGVSAPCCRAEKFVLRQV